MVYSLENETAWAMSEVRNGVHGYPKTNQKKCKNTQNILLDRSYLLFEEYLQEEKHVFVS